ncbi:NAD(P)H-hydrate dehydratase [Planctomicrobium sp.]|nr:NAD(P)H-hydrate dehydratase [Planctomicrobium sp.]
MNDAIPQLPIRPADGHKGTFGRLMIVGGSTGMAGAVSLSGMSALRSGAGLVSLAVPESIVGSVSVMEPSYMTIPLKDDSYGRISQEAIPVLNTKLAAMDSAALGPGLGRSSDLDRIVNQLYRTSELPLVLDADALNSLADQSEIISEHAGPRVLTPHPGEFGKLLGVDTSRVQRDRQALAMEFAAKNQLTIVLKGPETIVTDGEDCYVNQTGNAGMATGGSGDVLTGMIVSLIAQKMTPFDASVLGVYAHGLAGDLAASELSQRGMIASDLIKYLPYAWKKIESAQ